ncbi:MAG: M1 family metallopeptidase [bacterium]|nr:M1 family metallopeptidase [bacterium]
MSKKATRLFDQFQPENYKLELKFDKPGSTFTGKVVVTGRKVGRPSKRITFHQNALQTTSATIVKFDKGKRFDIKVARINNHNKFHELRLHSESMIYPGQYEVTIEFSGVVTKDMQGVYPCNFSVDGKDDFLIATQFEAHHAREAFPCIDEPEAKATFDLTLQSPKGDRVLSNTEPTSQTDDGKMTTTVFETTPIMSTYLLAFVIGQLQNVEGKAADGTVIRSWSTPAQPLDNLKFANNEAIKVIDFFSEYFETPFPLKKCDQVALPDFDSGAMENWGLITYRESALLTDPKNRSISNEQFVAMVIAHELSHQWFGNLVTMKWWDDLWLNESFASIMEHIALDNIHPDWKQWESFATVDILSATSRDIYKDVQAVAVEVEDPDLIETLFDPAIVYAKGARLIKMVIEYCGEQNFRDGLKDYFKKYAYKNATRKDLWEALSENTPYDIDKLMTPWLERSGMPVIDINQIGKTVEINQERYILDAKNDDSLWPVPMFSSVELSAELVTKKTTSLKTTEDKFAILNKDASGHYFVKYEHKKHRDAIEKQFASQEIPSLTRINVLNDMFMLAKRGDSSLTVALNFIDTAEKEPRDAVWSLILRIIGAASQLTEGDGKSEASLKKLKSKLAKPNFIKLGFDEQTDDDPNTIQLRHTALAMMLSSDSKEVISEAHDYFLKHTTPDLPAEIRPTILGTMVKHFPKDSIDKLLLEYSSALPDIQGDISSALSRTEDPAAAKRILETAIGDNGFVRDQDLMRWLVIFLRSYKIRATTWQFIIDNWEYIYKVFKNSKSFDFLPVYMAGVISTTEGKKQYSNFFADKKDIKVLQKNIGVGLSDIDARISWRNRDASSIKVWLSNI